MATALAPSRRFHSVPVIGWIARDIVEDIDSIWYALVILLTLVVIGVMTWGVMVLTLVALATVPVVFVILIMITLG